MSNINSCTFEDMNTQNDHIGLQWGQERDPSVEDNSFENIF